MGLRVVYVPLLFTLKREQAHLGWQPQSWRAVSAEVAFDQFAQEPRPVTHSIERSPLSGFVQNQVTVLVTMVLDRKEIPAYLVNIANGEPVLYAAVEETDSHLVVHKVTASAFGIDSTVGAMERVPMAPSVRKAIRSFVDSQLAKLPPPGPVVVTTLQKHPLL